MTLRLGGLGAILFDVDGSIVEGNVSKSIGKTYVKREIDRGHYGNLAIGAYYALWAAGYDLAGAEEKGMHAFATALDKAGCADRATGYAAAFEHIRKKKLPGVKEFVGYMRNRGIFTMVHTGGLDISADAAALEFEFMWHFSNYKVGLDGHVTRRAYSKNENAKEHLARFGINLKDCIVVGDSDSDAELMREAGLSIASPLAKPEIAAAAKIRVDKDYRELIA